MANPVPRSSETRLSYKFQRLREQLREAVASGELAGKLPGERALARRFGVNAKTLGKALTDLAAEGLLERSVGRGTFVKGQAPAPAAARWLVLVDEHTFYPWVDHLRLFNPSLLEHSGPIDAIRPSFLNGFSAVIDLARNTPDAFLRDLIVRNIPVVAAGYEPRSVSINSIVIDRALGVSRVVRQLMLDRHRSLGLVAGTRGDEFVRAARRATAAFDPAPTIDVFSPAEAVAAVQAGVTALVCDCLSCTTKVLAAVQQLRSTVAVYCVGAADGEIPAPGYYVTSEEMVAAIVERLNASPASRPMLLWLAGQFVDRPSALPQNASERPLAERKDAPGWRSSSS